jgi:hypothetical protein
MFGATCVYPNIYKFNDQCRAPTPTPTPVALPHLWTAHSAREGLPGTSQVLRPNVAVTGDLVTLSSDGNLGGGDWVWSMVGCFWWYGCPIGMTVGEDLQMAVLLRGNLAGAGIGRVELQFGLEDWNSGKWYELDINLLWTVDWPRPDARPDYFAVAPLGTYDIAGGPHYYAALDGPALGHAIVEGEWATLVIPLSAYVRKVIADNPSLFPDPVGGSGTLHLTSYGVAVESRDNELSTVAVEAMNLVRLRGIARKHLERRN